MIHSKSFKRMLNGIMMCVPFSDRYAECRGASGTPLPYREIINLVKRLFRGKHSSLSVYSDSKL